MYTDSSRFRNSIICVDKIQVPIKLA